MSLGLSSQLTGKIKKFSLDEQQIGVWIDSKPLYQKVLVLENPVSGYVLNIPNMQIVNVFGYFQYRDPAYGTTGDMTVPYSRATNNEVMFWTEGTSDSDRKLVIQNVMRFGLINYKTVVVLQYTKTTD